jgi:hypothetical protein
MAAISSSQLRTGRRLSESQFAGKCGGMTRALGIPLGGEPA